MITKLTGELVSTDRERAAVAIGALEYEVLIPDFVRRQLEGKVGQSISLHTIEYLEGNPTQGRLIPRIVGFLTTVEREFFEQFCSVDGVGVRKALRAMVRPVRDVAVLIEEQDTKGLSTLPGVGAATAERIVAKLRRKMSRFALLVASDTPSESSADSDVIAETFAALTMLGHTEVDARHLIDRALEQKKKPKDVESFLQLIYAQSRG
ncbi:MAG: Holliday junction DNA helicase RuvA [Planctomycetales bacterium]|nr:Holliday junction DNA helicase RuvA [Planctomycetales bacterium]